ncbi:MAG: hypothetical protein PHN93_04655, partial [Sphaerochaetaceae bacterium]|nr:hypothetical protein [Sphaerochaetaceae bacterium]
MSWRKGRLWDLILRGMTHFMLILFSLVIAYPIYFSIITSLKSSTDYAMDKVGVPTSPTIQNYIQVLLNMNMLRFMFNTVLLVGVS